MNEKTGAHDPLLVVEVWAPVFVVKETCVSELFGPCGHEGVVRRVFRRGPFRRNGKYVRRQSSAL